MDRGGDGCDLGSNVVRVGVMEKTKHDATRDYLELLHAMQSGVAMKMNFDRQETEPKHLRVGVNAAMVDHAGLVKLLIAKGVLTESEYVAAITDKMADEVATYEAELSTHLDGKTVKLG